MTIWSETVSLENLKKAKKMYLLKIRIMLNLGIKKSIQ